MTIAVDFDGVIHQYSRGWQDGSIYDPPMPGALDGLRTLMEGDAVFIFTTREPEQVAAWLTEHGLATTTDDRCPCPNGLYRIPDECSTCKGSGYLTFWNQRGQLLVTNRKLAAVAYLDDRAVRFTDWDQALTDLLPPSAPEPASTGNCEHCPDGHTPADQGSQPWGVYVADGRDGDGQPTHLIVTRAGGAHVAESDAEWIRQRLNPAGIPREPQPQPFTGTGRLGRGA
ncbi:hypothetical protein ACGFZS_09740 [Streptomyces sp. NPDC048288]|uniref:hypothetical protein n=1 Tax=Streptomyces sp. NPDC048288 TaxID=3365529 RepID=UPI00371D38D0